MNVSSLTIACAALAMAAVSLARQGQDQHPEHSPTTSTVVAREFVIVDEQNRPCARLSTKGGAEAVLEFLDRSGGRSLLEVGLGGEGGIAQIVLRDTWSREPGKCSAIVLENGGSPGVPTIKLIGAGEGNSPRGELVLAMDRDGVPELASHPRNGSERQLLKEK